MEKNTPLLRQHGKAPLPATRHGVFLRTGDISAGHRFCDPISERGCGFADPVSQRMTSFPANLLNCLPLLLTNPVMQNEITQTNQWRTSASLTLRSAHALLTGMARLARLPDLVDERQPSGTNPPRYSSKHCYHSTELCSSDGSISAERLAAAAHHHTATSPLRASTTRAHRARQRELAIPLTEMVKVTLLRQRRGTPPTFSIFTRSPQTTRSPPTKSRS